MGEWLSEQWLTFPQASTESQVDSEHDIQPVIYRKKEGLKKIGYVRSHHAKKDKWNKNKNIKSLDIPEYLLATISSVRPGTPEREVGRRHSACFSCLPFCLSLPYVFHSSLLFFSLSLSQVFSFRYVCFTFFCKYVRCVWLCSIHSLSAILSLVLLSALLIMAFSFL